MLATLEEKRTETSPSGDMPSPMAPSACDDGDALKDILLKFFLDACWIPEF